MSITDIFNNYKGRFDADLGIIHHFSDGLYARQMKIPKGYLAVSHAHNYSHLSVLASGRVIVQTDQWTKEFKAPACIEIKAGIHHKIIGLEDAVWFCVHSTDVTDEVDEVLIQRG